MNPGANWSDVPFEHIPHGATSVHLLLLLLLFKLAYLSVYHMHPDACRTRHKCQTRGTGVTDGCKFGCWDQTWVLWKNSALNGWVMLVLILAFLTLRQKDQPGIHRENLYQILPHKSTCSVTRPWGLERWRSSWQIGCSPRWPSFGYQDPRGSSHLPLTPGLKDPVLSSKLHGQPAHTQCAYTDAGNIHIHKNKCEKHIYILKAVLSFSLLLLAPLDANTSRNQPPQHLFALLFHSLQYSG